MTYKYCKKIIAAGNYETEAMFDKLDVFLLGNRLTKEQYTELTSMMNKE